MVLHDLEYNISWSPEYGQWQAGTVRDSELVSKFYLTNTAGAPLLEYTRHLVDKPEPQVHGRLYWNTDFTLYRGPAYDTTAFRRWYDHVAPWLRRNDKRVELQRTGISIGFRALGPRDTPRVDIWCLKVVRFEN